MINSNLILVWYARRSDRARGGKTYHAGFDLPTGISKISRRRHRTATEAVVYGERVKDRLIRLQAATPEPAQV